MIQWDRVPIGRNAFRAVVVANGWRAELNVNESQPNRFGWDVLFMTPTGAVIDSDVGSVASIDAAKAKAVSAACECVRAFARRAKEAQALLPLLGGEP